MTGPNRSTPQACPLQPFRMLRPVPGTDNCRRPCPACCDQAILTRKSCLGAGVAGSTDLSQRQARHRRLAPDVSASPFGKDKEEAGDLGRLLAPGGADPQSVQSNDIGVPAAAGVSSRLRGRSGLCASLEEGRDIMGEASGLLPMECMAGPVIDQQLGTPDPGEEYILIRA